MGKNRKDLGKAIFKKKIYIILITIIFAITGICYTLTNISYVVSQKILVGENENLIDTYKEILKGSTVLEEVIKNLGANITSGELNSLIEVNRIDNTNMMEIKVFGQDEVAVQNYANEITKVFIKTINEIYENAELYSVDSTASYYRNGNVVIVGISAAMIGLVLSSLFFAICFVFDNKIKSCKDIEDITTLKALISIPNIKVISKKKLNIKNIRAHKSDVFKTLMTNIQFVNTNNLKSQSILLTSPKPFEGKTYVATNLAIEFAKAGKKVIIIDGDMRRGRLARIFNLPNDLGFSNYLSNLDTNGNVINERITRFINDTEIKNLNVITSGNIPPNPAELLKNNKVTELIKDLKVFYDVIIFDTVSILNAPEAAMLAKVCDLTLILSAYGNTKIEELTNAYEQIENVHGSSVGLGLNKIPERKFKKKITTLKNNFKQSFNKRLKKIKAVFKKIKKVSIIFHKIATILKFIVGVIALGLLKIRNLIIRSMNGIKTKSQGVKEYIRSYKAKREKIKMIEAGSGFVETEEKNIIRDVFENEMAKLESYDEVQYKKKLDELKTNIVEKSNLNEEVNLEKVRMVSANSINQVKSKLDLMREQQEKCELSNKTTEEQQAEFNFENEAIQVEREEESANIIQEKIKNSVEESVINQEEIKRKHEELKKKQRIEREKKEAAKKLRQEQIETFQDIDFHNPENLTEEMIRKQVEMDEMIRLAEQEEEEEKLRIRKMKIRKKSDKRKERKEKFQKYKQEKAEQLQNIKSWFQSIKQKNEEKQANLERERIRRNETKIEEKIKKENEKNENRARIARR